MNASDLQILSDAGEASDAGAECWQVLAEYPRRIRAIAIADLHGRLLATLPPNERDEAVKHHAALADYIMRARTMVRR